MDTSRLLPILFFAASYLLCITPNDAHAQPTCDAIPATCSTLATLHNTLGTLPTREHNRAAKLFAAFSYTPALPDLQRCALSPNPTAPTCTQALLVFAQPQILPTLRQIVRAHGSHPDAVHTAAHALIAARDPFAHSTFLHPLLHTTHNPRTHILLASLLAQTDVTWRIPYLHFVMRHTPQPALRDHIALLLSSRLRTSLRSETTALLQPQLHTLVTHPNPLTLPQKNLLRDLAQTLSTASDSSCTALQSSLRSWMKSPDRRIRTRAASAAHAASERCTDRFPTAIPSSLLLVSSSPSKPNPPKQTPNTPHPLDTLLHNQLTHRSLTWNQDTILQHTRRSLRWRPTPLSKRRETLAASYPKTFDRVSLRAPQPAWWPKSMLLTIDDGPRPEILRDVLHELNAHNVHALFFFVGSSLVRRSLEDPEGLRSLLRDLLDQGHEIGYHSMNHETLKSRRLLTRDHDQLRDDVENFKAVLRQVVGRDVDIRYGRTPGGHGSRTGWMRAGFHNAGLHAPVTWTAGPPDWTPSTPHEDIPALAARWSERTDPQWILLHESPGLHRELRVYFKALKSIQ